MTDTNTNPPATAVRVVVLNGLLWLSLIAGACLPSGCSPTPAAPTAAPSLPAATATPTITREPASATPTPPDPTAAPPTATPVNTNLALDRPVTCSSEEGPQNTMEHAVDGSTTTRWSSKYSDPQWFSIDLGERYTIRHVTLKWEASGLHYQLQVSDDGVAWTDIYSTTSGANNGGYKEIDEVDVDASGRYVRMYGTKRSSTWGFSLYEFEVYEEWEAPATPTTRPAPTLETPTITPPPGMHLVWHDEFDGDRIDPTNWVHDLGAGANHDAYYTDRPENSYVQDGNLIIVLRREENGEWCLNGPCQYTSALVRTARRQSWQYGRFEARIKAPEGWGVWPAFWTMGDDGNWPDCGEVDIMEMIGGEASGREDTTFAAMHWGDDGHQSRGSADQIPGRFSEAYHVFALEWDSQEFRWYLDDNPEPFYTARNDESGMEEYHQPHFLLLNVAVGGGWAGMPNENTVFPQRMVVDWVRVYQKPEWLYTPTPTPTGFYSRRDDTAVYPLEESLAGTVTSEFDVTILAEGFTGYVGYHAPGADAGFLDWPVRIRLGEMGDFRVLDGDGYAALETVQFGRDETHHFKVVISLDDQAVDVWVTPPGGSAVQIARGYAFHPQPAPVTEIGQLLVRSEKDNQFRVTDHVISVQP